MDMNLPKAISLCSDEGHHAGFMLMAFDESQRQGQCVFMLSPASSEGIDSKMGIVISELKVLGEHQFKAKRVGEGFEILVLPEGFPQITFKLDNKFAGDVVTEFDGSVECIGTCEAAKKNA